MSYSVQNPTLPLAVYREVAVHLTQVDGVQTRLTPQTSQQFEYTLSQIESLEIEFSNPNDSQARSQVEKILAYYGDRFGAWTILSDLKTR
ncbi:hypothetical protein [Leptolyngbya sp. NIES-2104]|uniref:hypothetical protein n=1 Tax=Leptolyngbya sp. NIES-2104 TaxID=1552121 RepID=UPI0006EC755D|nr:hypothetical protein [Leptolyngbya sp. NIES-2104]GAP96444.1 hypothetical protein NIES2104_29810 [Leptolyngbya sp. NIES-2104]